MARPTKLTDDVRDRIVSALTAGNYQDTAAAYAGISPATFHAWMARGRAERDSLAEGNRPQPRETPYREFLEAVESARAQAEIRSVALIQKAAQDGTWQAAAWFLERSHPQRWGRIQRTEISGPDGGPIATTVDVSEIEQRLSRFFGLDEEQPDRP